MRGDIGEDGEMGRAGEQGVGVAAVAVEAEVAGACRLAYHKDINLGAVGGMCAAGVEGERRRGGSIVCRDGAAPDGKREVVAHVGGIEAREDAVAAGRGVEIGRAHV